MGNIESASRSGVIRVKADGAPIEVDDNALAILRVSREQYMEAPPGAFSAQKLPPDEEKALRDEWERAGRPELLGASSIRRGDGTQARVSFLIEEQMDGTFVALITPIDEPVSRPPTVFTAADVLREWRSAERRMAEVPAGTREWEDLSSRVAELRATYHRLVSRRHGGGAAG